CSTRISGGEGGPPRGAPSSRRLRQARDLEGRVPPGRARSGGLDHRSQRGGEVDRVQDGVRTPPSPARPSRPGRRGRHEPTAGRAPLVFKEIFRIVENLRRLGQTILMVEQNAAKALEISDYAYVLELGQNRYEGSGQEIGNDDRVRRLYLGR